MHILFFSVIALWGSDNFIVTDRPFTVTERVEAKAVEEKKPVIGETVKVEQKPFKPYVAMFTADYCGPCRQFKSTEEAKVIAAGYEVHHITDLSGITSIPRFVVVSETNKSKNLVVLAADTPHKGFTSASTLIADLKKADVKVSKVGERYTLEELRSWVHKNYTKTTALERATMKDDNQVLIHLTGQHGFVASQVNGLLMWEALALHDAVHPKVDKHGNTISPPLITAIRNE